MNGQVNISPESHAYAGIYYITLTFGAKSPVTLGSWRPFQFDTLPVQSVLPRPPPSSEREKQLIDEITKLQTKGLLGKSLPVLMNLFQIFFLVPKKTGDFCPVINLKPLNQFVQIKGSISKWKIFRWL